MAVLGGPQGLACGGTVFVGCDFDGEWGSPARGESDCGDSLHVIGLQVVGCQDFVQWAAVALHKGGGSPDMGV